MRFRTPLSFLYLLAALAGAAPAAAQVLAPNLLYTSVQPCRLFDTRHATNGTNGRLIHGVNQTFNVVGNNADPYFTGQGGHTAGCALPGFKFNSPQVQAVVLNFVAVGSAGGGDLVAWPTDQAQTTSSIINYANSAQLGFLNIANGIVVPVRQDMAGADITLKAQVSDTDILADVVGYFSNVSAVQGGEKNVFLGGLAGNPAVATGSSNTAIGYQSMSSNTVSSLNVAVGGSALRSNQTGGSNTALGSGALSLNSSGSTNVAIGDNAGLNIVTGSNNIDIANTTGPDESSTIRIGDGGSQTAAFIAGIDGATSSSGTAVFVNATHQLGTVTSSLRFKEDVADMAEASAALLRLRPVTFHYKPAYDDGSRLLQYGLIAEEVARVYPDLVQYDQEGQPQAVRYHFVNAMLLNEVQKQHARIEELQTRLAGMEMLQAQVAAQRDEIASQRAEITHGKARCAALEARLARLEAAAE